MLLNIFSYFCIVKQLKQYAMFATIITGLKGILLLLES